MNKNKINQYPFGKDLLWMIHYRPTKENSSTGNMNGTSRKMSGTLIQVAKIAQELAEENNLLVQCIRRRY